MPADTALKPCPFCGGAPAAQLVSYWTVVCPCGVAGPLMPSAEGAAARWNRREPTDAYTRGARDALNSAADVFVQESVAYRVLRRLSEADVSDPTEGGSNA